MTRHVTRRRILISLGLLLLLLWWLWPSGQLARVEALQKELANAGDTLTPEQRREKGQQIRAEMEKLTPEERSQLRASFQKRMEERMAKYFAMSPQEKQKHLDSQINGMQQAMAQGQPKGGPGPNANGGGGQRRPMTSEEKEKRRQQRLDATTPEFRGQMDQYRKDMEQRRQQLGLPPSPPGRGGR